MVLVFVWECPLLDEGTDAVAFPVDEEEVEFAKVEFMKIGVGAAMDPDRDETAELVYPASKPAVAVMVGFPKVNCGKEEDRLQQSSAEQQ